MRVRGGEEGEKSSEVRGEGWDEREGGERGGGGGGEEGEKSSEVRGEGWDEREGRGSGRRGRSPQR